MPPTARADDARLIGDRAGEAAAPMAEQLAVGELARRARAVVGQEHVRLPRGDPAWIARATRSLPVPLSPVISTVRSLPCSRWIWSATRCIAALAQTNPGSSGSSDRSTTPGAGFDGTLARAAQLESLAQDGAERAEAAAASARANGRGRRDDRASAARPPSRPMRLDRPAADDGRRARARGRAASARARVGVAARPPRRRATVAERRLNVKMTAACASHASSSAVAPSRASSAGMTAASTSRRTIAASPSMRGADDTRRSPPRASSPARHAPRARSGCAPSDSKIASASVR